MPPHWAPPQKLKLLHVPAEHEPHEPPHPSEPQVLPVQLGVHVETHLPAAEHVPSAQVPQEPPHPLGPHERPLHAGMQAASLPASAVPEVPEVPLVPDVPLDPDVPLVPELPELPDVPLASGSVACSGSLPAGPVVPVPSPTVPPVVPALHATTESETATIAGRKEGKRMMPCRTAGAPYPSRKNLSGKVFAAPP